MGALFVAVLCLVASIGHFQDTRCIKIQCTSTGGYKACTPDLPSGVRISKVTALKAYVNGDTGSPCKGGYHFGTYPRRMWVDLKCGGEFGICHRANTEMKCTFRILHSSSSSTIKKYYVIDLNDDIHVMYVSGKISNKCIEEETYGKENNKVWVSSGCTGRFYICVLK